MNEEAIFSEALEKGSRAQRSAYLHEACGADTDLRVRVEQLLEVHDHPGSLLDSPAHTQALTRATCAAMPERLGDFEIVREIARGGMGVVYAARQISLNRQVALKVLAPGLGLSAKAVTRFGREAEAAAKLDHSNIVPIHYAGEEGGISYYVMALIHGQTLAALLSVRQAPDHDRAKFLGIFEKICQTMAYAHSHGVIHRDLKPSNIMVGEFGEVQIMDWGLAKMFTEEVIADENESCDRDTVSPASQSEEGDTPQDLGQETRPGCVLGTPAYMPPEQALGEVDRLDERCDVFGLGAILCEILTGNPPYVGADSQQIFRQARRGMLDDCFAQLSQCEAEPELVRLAKRSLAAELEERLPNAGAVADGVTRYLNSLQEQLKKAELARVESETRVEEGRRRRKLHVAIAGLMLLVALGAMAAAGSFWRISQNNKRLAKDSEVARQAEGEKSKQLEQQLRTETVTRLVAQSVSLREQWPIRSVLLAIEAVETTRRNDGTIMPVAHETLLNAAPLVAGKPLLGHEAPVAAMAISPDGRWLVTGSGDDTVRIWDLRAAEPSSSAVVLRGHQDDVKDVAISPDGRWLVTGSTDKTARMWDLDAENPGVSPRVFRGHEAGVASVAISADGHWLATGSQDGTVRLWDLTAEDPTASSRMLQGLEQCQYRVEFSSNGRWLLTSPDRKGKKPLLWDLAAEDPASTPLVLAGHEPTTISPDGRWLVTTGLDGNALLWDLTRDDPASSPRELPRRPGGVQSLAISPNGRWLITGERTVWLWDLTAPDSLPSPRELPGHVHQVWSIAISADSRWLVTGGSDMTVRLWDLTAEDPASSSRILVGVDSAVDLLSISRDGRSLVTGARNSSVVRLWDLDTVRLCDPESDYPTGSPLVLPGHQDVVCSMATSPDGRWIVTSCADKTARVWDLAAANPAMSSQALRGHKGKVRSVSITADGRWVATGSGDGTARLWDRTADDLAAAATLLTSNNDSAPSVAISPNGRWVVAGCSDGSVRFWDRTAEDPAFAPLHGRGHQGPVSQIAISPDGRWLVTASFRGNVPRLWDLTLQDPTSSVRALRGHTAVIWSVAISADGRWLATAGSDKTARLWDLSAEDPTLAPRVIEASEGIWRVAIGPQGRELFAASFGVGGHQLWRLAPDGRVVASNRVQGHHGVGGAAISPDGRWLATGSKYQTAQLWDLTAADPVASPRVLRGHTGSIWAVTFTADGRWLVTAGDDGVLRLWDLNLESLLDRARRAAARELTAEERKQYLADDPAQER